MVPDNIPDHSNMSSEEIRVWVSEQFTPIFDNVTSVTREFLNGAGIQQNITDSINTYANLVVELGLIHMELCNIVKRPNRDRLLRLMKYIMLVLKGHNNRSKYALEMLRLLCQQFALLSEQCAHCGRIKRILCIVISRFTFFTDSITGSDVISNNNI